MDPGEAVENNGSVPKGWKIKPDKHKKQETIIDHQNVILPYNQKTPEKDFQLKQTRRKHEEIMYSCDHHPWVDFLAFLPINIGERYKKIFDLRKVISQSEIPFDLKQLHQLSVGL